MHPTNMNMHTKMSEKGQVVVPKAVRDRLGWLPGTDLDVIETEDGVTFRPRSTRKKLTVEQAVARFRELYTHVGPPATLEQMRESAQGEASRNFERR